MDTTPFTSYLGMQLVSAEPGRAVMSLELKPHHLNRRGVPHGGVITSLLDSALGAAVIASMPSEWWCATTSLSTQFIAGAGAGQVTATGRVLHRGGKVAFAAGEVRDAGGRLIATAHGSWHLWSRKPGTRPAPAAPSALIGPAGERIRVGKIVAIGRNYAKHIEEMGGAPGSPPVFFLKPSTALVPGGGTVAVPTDAGAVHHEIELVAVIGRRCRRVSAGDALDHVLGYAVGLDLTLRDLQSEAKQRGEPWSLSKGFDGSAPISAIVPRESVGDGSGLAVSLSVNERVVQQGNTSRMLHTVADLVAHASRRMTLEPGDLLFTGTPEGVGPVQPGDRLSAAIDNVGTLEVTIAAETRTT